MQCQCRAQVHLLQGQQHRLVKVYLESRLDGLAGQPAGAGRLAGDGLASEGALRRANESGLHGRCFVFVLIVLSSVQK